VNQAKQSLGNLLEFIFIDIRQVALPYAACTVSHMVNMQRNRSLKCLSFDNFEYDQLRKFVDSPLSRSW